MFDEPVARRMLGGRTLSAKVTKVDQSGNERIIFDYQNFLVGDHVICNEDLKNGIQVAIPKGTGGQIRNIVDGWFHIHWNIGPGIPYNVHPDQVKHI